MNIFKNKLLWIAPIATMIILVIFSLAFYPAYNPKPKDLPIGILNEDKGTTVKSRLLCKMLYNVFTISTYQN
ncbi:Phage infection protein [Staphylococcus aureus]|nr:Phage infection protein [Staphylococcus aureus]